MFAPPSAFVAAPGAITSSVIGGVASGIGGNTAGNIMNNNPISINIVESGVLGGIFGGISGSLANEIAPVGPGRPPAATLFNGGIKSARELDNHSVSEGINGILCYSVNCPR